MDDKDRMLLASLRRDGRRPLVALARDVQLSRSATQERLARLQRSGAIRAFTIVEGDPAQRQGAHCLVRLLPGKTCAQAVPHLRKIAAIAAMDSIAGEFDMLIRLEADSVASIEAARAAISATPQVADVTTYITLERHCG